MQNWINKIIQGDALEVLKTLPDESINCCMTSPPYWALRDYGTANWVGGDENCDHKVGRDTRNGLTELQRGSGGSFGDEAIKIGESCPMCGAIRKDLQLGLEPTFDEFINNLCNIYDEVKRVLRKDGTCWVNLGDTYANAGNQDKRFDKKDYGIIQQNVKRKVGRGIINDYPSKCLTLVPFRFVIEMINRGWILRNVIIWHKPNCMPSSVKDRFTVDFEYIFFFVKNKRYWFDLPREKMANVSIERAKYIEFNKSEKLAAGIHGGMNLESQRRMFEKVNQGDNMRAKRTVWKIPPKPFSEAHFAVYPEELCETPLKSGCPEGGIVLDPFFGSGTTGIVALKQNKKFIGIELNPEYIEIANRRLKPHLEQTKLKSF